nr:DUF4157 domain-containing protein [Fibrobacter succinogenes]
MSTTYAQRQTTAQKKDASSASSVLDNSSQSESLQRKADMANNAAQRAEAPRPNNTGMPDNLKAGIESLSGFSMDDVRVHYNSSKPATVQALAYTQGTDIHVAPGQEKHLPHEAWHVAQQMAGRVSPTTNINGMPVNDNAALEHEADVMGEKAVSQRLENVKKLPKSVHKFALQLKPGDPCDMVCAADILYRDGKKIKHVKGVGYNDCNPNSISSVLEVFNQRNLTKLATPNYQHGPNPPGQCAEPHAFADALKKDSNINASNILDVFISESVIRKLATKKITNVSTGDKPLSIKTYSRCETCAQWIQSDGHVKPSYLQKEEKDKPGIINFSNEDSSILKKYDKMDDEKMVFTEKKFHNVNFLIQEHSPLPDWFKEDDEIKKINSQENLRTIIKKQLLKNRTCEIINQAINIVRLVTAYSDVQECSIFSSEYVEKINELKNVLRQEGANNQIQDQIKKATDKETQKKLSMRKKQIIKSSKTIRSEIENKINKECETVYSTIDQIAETEKDLRHVYETEKDLRHVYDFIQQNRKIGTDEFTISENLGFTKEYTEYILGILAKKSLITPPRNRKERDLARKKARDRKYSWD